MAMFLGGLICAVEANTRDREESLFGASAEVVPRQLGSMPRQIFVRIVEQPARNVRFRYECEGRLAGSVQGVNSRRSTWRTYPSIEICGPSGTAITVVSCVTTEAPYRPHPHNLVGRENCENGVCIVKDTITEDNLMVSFSTMGIQCVKRKGIAKSLRTRKWLRVDPFKTGFSHSKEPQSIDLNAVRLCFQVFIRADCTNRVLHSLPPVLSDIIYDKKALNELIIRRISHYSGSSKGNTEVILLCERVTKEDVMVVFFQKDGDRTVWEANADIVLVHHQCAVVFLTPPYHNPNEQNHVVVYVQLTRTSDNVRSNAIPFEYFPDKQGTQYLWGIAQKPTVPSLSAYKGSMTPPHQTSPRSVGPSYKREHDISYQQYILNLPGPNQMQQNYTHLRVPQQSPSMQPSNLPSMPSNRNGSSRESMSPSMGPVSPILGHGSPITEHISPNPIQQQQLPQQEPMEASSSTGTPSITGLLMECGEGEFSDLASLLNARGDDLSDSLSKLSTSDLLGAVVNAEIL